MRILFIFLALFVFLSTHAIAQDKLSYGKCKELFENPKPGTSGEEIAKAYQDAISSLQKLNEPDQYDELLRIVSSKYADVPEVLTKMVYMRGAIPPYGYRIGDKFTRGQNRSGTGEVLFCGERDRVFMAKLMLRAMYNAKKELPEDFYLAFAMLFQHYNAYDVWKLQALTDLYGELPDYTQHDFIPGSRPPVNSDGSPVFYSVPSSFEAAKNDGERARFLLSKAGKSGADFYYRSLKNQLDPSDIFSRINQYSIYHETEDGLRLLNSLSDDETLAWLTNGVQRIQLPPEQNYIRYFQKTKDHRILAEIYLARAQFDRALVEYKIRLKDSPKDTWLREQIRQIEGDGGSLIPLKTAPAGREPELELIFRNAKTAKVTIRDLDKGKAGRRIIELFSKPQTDLRHWNLSIPEWEKHLKDCIGPERAAFDLPLDPKAKHFDTVKKFTLPVKDAGLYLVSVAFNGGAKTEMIVALSQYTLTKAQISRQSSRMLLNDSVTGAPVVGEKVDFHFFKTIYAQKPEDIKKYGKVRIETSTHSAVSGKDGTLGIPKKDGVLIARAVVNGKTAMYYGHEYSQRDVVSRHDKTASFFITDRPIYKPGDSVEFSAFLRRASYSEAAPLAWPKSISIQVTDPMGKKLYTADMPVSQKTGAIAGRFPLPSDTKLGRYTVSSLERKFPGSISFRVEEYKKPEFQVKVNMPSAPVKSGEAFTASVAANYYFGQPVTDADVTCNVYREQAMPFFPIIGPFDWLFGRGYLMVTSKCNWRFYPYYMERSLVGEFKGKTSEKGTFEFKVDTAGVKEKFGDKNYRYTVTAELSDSSRRVISASGEIFAIAKPFEVFVYPLRGFTGVNDAASIRIAARDPNGSEVAGRGVLKIFRMKLDSDGVCRRDGDVLKSIRFESGETPSFRLNRGGVYEAFVEFHAKNGASETGSCIFRVRGDKDSGELFSDLPLELSTSQATYAPGETAELLISSDKPGSYVYLFTDKQVKLLKLDGYSTVVPLPIKNADCPNIFVTALLIRDGVTTHVTKQIYVPPASKMLNVKINLPQTKVQPRSKVPVELEVTGPDGKPVSGAFAVTVYDKSLEGLAQNNVQALNSFFWGWKRWSYSNFMNDLSKVYDSYTAPVFAALLGFDHGYRVKGLPREAKASGALYDSVAAAPMAARKEMNVVAEKSMAAKSEATFAWDSNAGSGGAEPVIRSDFLDRAFWIGQRVLESDGKVRFEVPVPDNLTTWAVKVWSLTPDTKVGEGSAEFIVSKDFIARLELPRFLVEGDTVDARAIIHNYTKSTAKTELKLQSSSANLKCGDGVSVSIPAGGSKTVPFKLTAAAPCRAELTLTAESRSGSDALRLPLSVLVRGAEIFVPTTGRLSNQKAQITFRIPSKIHQDTVNMTVSLAPGAATAMVDLLPYLASDDSANVFGVVNRFLPVLSAKYALEKIGVPFEKAVSGSNPRGELPYSEYKKGLSDAVEFERMADDNLKMVMGMVNADGGWGWFSGYREVSYADTTAYVASALFRAKKMGRAINDVQLKRAYEWLTKHAEERCVYIQKNDWVSNTDALVLNTLAEGGFAHSKLFGMVFERRHQLAPYGMTLLAMSVPAKSKEASAILTQLEQFVKTDAENGTAYLNLKPSWWFFWYGNDTSTQAEYLRLLMRDLPQSPLIEPLAKYLTVNIRNAPSRNSVRALGDAVRTLADYVMFKKENAPNLNLRLVLDENEICSFPVTAENLWNGDFRIELPCKLLTPGVHKLEIVCKGSGAVYYDTMLNYFSTEDQIAPTGLEMKLERKYYRLERKIRTTDVPGVSGHVQSLQKEDYERTELQDLSSVAPGTLVEVELIADTKNDYDYVEFSDYLPAGFEYVKPVSGYITWWPAAVYAEFREQGPRFSQRSLGRGKNSIRYQIRAQLDGSYTARPAAGKGVYAPVLRCGTGYFHLGVK